MRTLVLLALLGCEPQPPAPTTPTAPTAPTTPATPVDADEPRLSVEYPGIRTLHDWRGRHAHSVEWASKDPLEKVRAYYRRYAAQNPWFKVKETADGMTLDGGAAYGYMRIDAARPGDDKLQPGEQTRISSSRP